MFIFYIIFINAITKIGFLMFNNYLHFELYRKMLIFAHCFETIWLKRFFKVENINNVI